MKIKPLLWRPFSNLKSISRVWEWIGRRAAAGKRLWDQAWPRRRFRAGGFLLLVLLAAWLFLRFSPIPFHPEAPGHSAAFLASDGSLLRLRLSGSGTYRLPLPLEKISPRVAQGFVHYEDKWFWFHPGVNPVAVLRALKLNFFSGKILSGASTIPMQLAKGLNPRARTFRAKIGEALLALQLEARYSKKQILDFYLNLVPMGGNLQGVGAASLFYFGRPADELSWSEAALLVSLPRSPTARRPDLHPKAAREGRDKVLERWQGEITGLPSKSETEGSAVPQKRFPNPRRAPHFVDRADQLAGAPSGVVSLTLDPAYQDQAEKKLGEAVAKLKPLGVHNGALIVVDNRTLNILAYVGSVDLKDPEGGQVNGCNILRSPGSALKPFLYALALQGGLITPRQLLTDIPRDYGSFKPTNYEGHFSGVVQAKEALARSLNLPAVDLESKLQGVNGGLREWIRGLGFSGEKNASLDPGLSMVLGGYPVTLEELVSLYAALANGGLWRPLNFLKDEKSAATIQKRLFSPAVCYLTAEMLSEVHRPDLPRSWEFSPTHSRVAFKTGTSFGFRDAWCVGFTPDFTIGVWLGNASAKGSPVLVAADTAAPVVLDLFNQWTRTKDHWFTPPRELAYRKVCSVTGSPLGDFCPSGVEDAYLPGISRKEPCDLHRKIFIRKSDGKEACFACMSGPASLYGEKIVEVWPPDVQWFLQKNGRSYDVIPDHIPGCPRYQARPGPRIMSPSGGGHYEMKTNIPLESQKVALLAQAGSDAGELYWFLGDKLISKGRPEDPLFWTPEPGRWEMKVLDSRGRSASVSFSVFGKKPEKFLGLAEEKKTSK